MMVTDGNEGHKGEDEEWKAPIEWLRRPPGRRKTNMDNRKERERMKEVDEKKDRQRTFNHPRPHFRSFPLSQNW